MPLALASCCIFAIAGSTRFSNHDRCHTCDAEAVVDLGNAFKHAQSPRNASFRRSSSVETSLDLQLAGR
nr:hypothetical protein CFP56_54861 [Quercus suber]